MDNYILPRKQVITVFFVFAFGYFLSCLLRAITATLSPVFTLEFDLMAADLGLLAGGYFLGCLLYTSPSPRDGLLSRMPSSA